MAKTNGSSRLPVSTGRPRPKTGLLKPLPNKDTGEESSNNSTTVISTDAKFKSGPQVNIPAFSAGATGNIPKGQSQVPKKTEVTDVLFTQVMRDPTCRLAFEIVISMLMKMPWTIEGGDPEYNEALLKTLVARQEMMIRSTIRGLLRSGWRGFEVVYQVVETTQYIVGIKALKNSITTPLAYVDTGEFAGFENKAYNQRDSVVIDAEHCVFVNFDDEGTGDLPDPLLKTMEGPFVKWEKCDEGAQRYDAKVAGGFLFGTYPVGRTMYNGSETENDVIWNIMAQNIVAGGYAGVPIRIDSETNEPIGRDAWSLEHVSAGGGLQPGFIDRLKYLDALKMRVMGIPERTATEGQFGTKAEAGSHAEIAIVVNVGRLRILVKALNDGPIKSINMANHEDPEYARLVLGELSPDDRALFGEIFKSLMSDPIFGDEVATAIDTKALLKKLNVPTLSEEELAIKEAEIEQKKQENMLRQQEQFGEDKDEDDLDTEGTF